MKVKQIITPKNVILLGLFLLPFVYCPWAKIRYEIPKVEFFNRWVEVLFLVSLLPSNLSKTKKNINSAIAGLVLIFLGWVIFSSVIGVDFYKSLFGNTFRVDGLLTLIHLLVLFFIFTFYYNKEWNKHIFTSIAAGSFLVSLWTVYSSSMLLLWNGPNIFFQKDFFLAPFGNLNFLAGYLVVVLPFSAYVLRTRKKITIFIVLIQILAILFTKSWAGILGVAIFLTGWFILIKPKYKRVSIFLITLLIFISPVVYFYWVKSQENPSFIIADSRVRILQKASMAFTQKPIVGWGWANFDYAFNSVKWPPSLNDKIYVDKAHAEVVEILVTTGVVGLSIYLLLVYKVVFELKSRTGLVNKYLLLSLFLYFVHAQTNVISISESVIFWLILGMTAAPKD